MRQTFCLFKSNYGQPDVGSYKSMRKTHRSLLSVSQTHLKTVVLSAPLPTHSSRMRQITHPTSCRGWENGFGFWFGFEFVYIFHINVYKLCVFIRKIQWTVNGVEVVHVSCMCRCVCVGVYKCAEVYVKVFCPTTHCCSVVVCYNIKPRGRPENAHRCVSKGMRNCWMGGVMSRGCRWRGAVI